MTTISFADQFKDCTPVQCGCCHWTGVADNLEPIDDAERRIVPGKEAPAGCCPSCGNLAYLKATTYAALRRSKDFATAPALAKPDTA